MPIVLMLLALAMAAPSLPAQEARDARVLQVGYQLATRNLALCPDRQSWWSGFQAAGLMLYPPASRAAQAARFGNQPHPVVEIVVPGSAAEAAGLRAGQVILSVDGVATPNRLPAQASFTAISAIESAIEKPSYAVSVREGSNTRTISIKTQRGCLSRLSVLESGKRNAWADGTYVQFTTRAISMAQTDDELAFLIAHEMAHNILGHPDYLDRVGKRASRVKATEIEADRLGMRLMHGAGFDVNAAPRFWRRFGRDFGIFSAPTHMRKKDRIVLLEEEARALTAQ